MRRELLPLLVVTSLPCLPVASPARPPGAGELPDPRRLLERAVDACLELDTIRYRGRYEEFGERHASGVTEAEVLLARGDDAAGGEVRFRVTGRRWYRERTTPALLDAAFDGAVLRSRDAARRTVRERRFEELAPGTAAWPSAAGELGAGGNGVVLWSLVQAEPLERWLEREDLEYEGRTAVLGTPCHVVVIPGDGPHESTRLFLAEEDGLPRKVERIAVTLTDRISGSLLTLQDVHAEPFPDDAFRLPVPADHELVPVEARVPEDTLLPVGSVAPDFTLRDPEGNELSLSDLRGRTVVLDFWGTWCGPCIRKLPELQELHARNADRAVTVLAVSCHEPPNARPAEVLARRGCELGLLLEGEDVAAAYGVPAFPSVVVVAPDGRIAFRRRGGASVDELQAAVDAALAAR